MGQIVILGVFVADTSFRAARLPKMGETHFRRQLCAWAGRQGF